MMVEAVSLKSRFNLYRSRGKRPSYSLERKTTSRNARFLIDALQAGNSVDVSNDQNLWMVLGGVT